MTYQGSATAAPRPKILGPETDANPRELAGTATGEETGTGITIVETLRLVDGLETMMTHQDAEADLESMVQGEVSPVTGAPEGGVDLREIPKGGGANQMRSRGAIKDLEDDSDQSFISVYLGSIGGRLAHFCGVDQYSE